MGKASASYARFSAIFVALLLVACMADAHQFIYGHASDIPFADDATLVDGLIAWKDGWTWPWLFSQHNEHRVPLPKAIQFLLYLWTGDVRSGMYAQVWILAAAAIIGIATARRLRGRFDLSDACFPLAFLQVGNHENLLMGFQVCIAFPVLLVMIFLWGLLRPTSEDRPARSTLVACSVACLPLCGGYGLILTPALCAALLGRAWITRRTRSGLILTLGAALGLLALGLYFVGYESPPKPGYSHSLAALCAHVPVHWSIAFGNYSAMVRGWLWYPVAALILGTLAWCAWRLWRTRGSDSMALILGCTLGAAVLYGLSMSYGRPAYMDRLVANRYMPFPWPFLSACFFASLLSKHLVLRTLVPMLLALGVMQAQPAGNAEAIYSARVRRNQAQVLQSMLDDRAPFSDFALRYSQLALQMDSMFVVHYLEQAEGFGVPPFHKRHATMGSDRAALVLTHAPDLVSDGKSLTLRRVGREVAAMLQAPAELTWNVRQDRTHFVLEWEPHPDLLARGLAPPIPYQIEQHQADGKLSVLSRGVLDHPFAVRVAVDGPAAGQLVLRLMLVSANPVARARAWIALQEARWE